jgi:hypothetical protein
MKTSWKDTIPAGHPAAKREGFVQLVNLLYKLEVTYYIAIPVMSNPYHLLDTREGVSAGWRRIR